MLLGLLNFLSHNTYKHIIYICFYVGLDALGHCENKSVLRPPRSYMEKSKFSTIRRSEENKRPPSTFLSRFIIYTLYITQVRLYTLVALESWCRSFS